MIDKTHNIRLWGWWLTVGVVLVVIGVILLSAPIAATVASVLTFGILLISAAVVHVITAILERHSSHFWLHLVIAVLTLVIGLLMLINPTTSLGALTLLIAAFFLSDGLFRIIGSVATRFKGWGWYFLNGIINLILGILILAHWPESSLWVIGLFMGINFIFAGWSLIMLSLFVKKGTASVQSQV